MKKEREREVAFIYSSDVRRLGSAGFAETRFSSESAFLQDCLLSPPLVLALARLSAQRQKQGPRREYSTHQLSLSLRASDDSCRLRCLATTGPQQWVCISHFSVFSELMLCASLGHSFLSNSKRRSLCMILAARPQDTMASFWDSYNEQQQQQQAGQQGNSPGPSMPGHEQGISAPIPSTSSTRHNSVLDSVHSASFLYQSSSDDLQQFQANLNASRSLPQPTHFGHFDPRHTGYDSYLSVSPKTVDSPGLMPPLPMSFPPFNTSMNKPSSGRPVVYEPYPHNFGASFSTGSTINPAASSNPYASQGYQSNMAKLEGTSASAQQQASQTPSSTIGELLNSIPRGEQHLSNALVRPSHPSCSKRKALTFRALAVYSETWRFGLADHQTLHPQAFRHAYRSRASRFVVLGVRLISLLKWIGRREADGGVQLLTASPAEPS